MSESFSYLYLCTKLPSNLAAWNNNHLWSHSYGGSGSWEGLGWVIMVQDSHNAAIKVSASLQSSETWLGWRIHPLPRLWTWLFAGDFISLPCWLLCRDAYIEQHLAPPKGVSHVNKTAESRSQSSLNLLLDVRVIISVQYWTYKSTLVQCGYRLHKSMDNQMWVPWGSSWKFTTIFSPLVPNDSHQSHMQYTFIPAPVSPEYLIEAPAWNTEFCYLYQVWERKRLVSCSSLNATPQVQLLFTYETNSIQHTMAIG